MFCANVLIQRIITTIHVTCKKCLIAVDRSWPQVEEEGSTECKFTLKEIAAYMHLSCHLVYLKRIFTELQCIGAAFLWFDMKVKY